MIVKSGALKGQAELIDLKDNDRALVWVDGRFETVLVKGLYALWTAFRDVRVEVIDLGEARFEHPDLTTILRSNGVLNELDKYMVEPGHVGLYFRNGEYVSSLKPGVHAFWKDAGKITLHHIDLRETVADVSGHEVPGQHR